LDWHLRRSDRTGRAPAPLHYGSLRRLCTGRARYDAPRLLRELHPLRAVPDGEVGRQRAVAGLTMKRILSIIGWVGTALVFIAVAIRFIHPEWNQYATWMAWAGLVAVLAYMAGQW